MSINIETKEIEIIKDCRNLTRGEMLGFISMDCYNLNLDKKEMDSLLSALIKGPWEIKCIPSYKSIIYSATPIIINKTQFSSTKNIQIQYNTSFPSYSAEFIPRAEKGISINYTTPTTKYAIDWTVQEVIDLIGV